MKVNIKRFEKDLPLPEYKTSGAAGFDLYSRENINLKSGETVLIPSNLVIKIPRGYFLLILGRSSTPIKFGLFVFPGVVDPDYCGEEDEIKISVYNLSCKRVEIAAGTRIAQGIFVKISKPRFAETAKMSRKSRGGFGSTGH